MKVNVIAIAKAIAVNSGWKVTENKTYPVLKITYDRYNPDGRITIIDDTGKLERITSNYFIFKTI